MILTSLLSTHFCRNMLDAYWMWVYAPHEMGESFFLLTEHQITLYLTTGFTNAVWEPVMFASRYFSYVTTLVSECIGSLSMNWVHWYMSTLFKSQALLQLRTRTLLHFFNVRLFSAMPFWVVTLKRCCRLISLGARHLMDATTDLTWCSS